MRSVKTVFYRTESISFQGPKKYCTGTQQNEEKESIVAFKIEQNLGNRLTVLEDCVGFSKEVQDLSKINFNKPYTFHNNGVV